MKFIDKLRKQNYKWKPDRYFKLLKFKKYGNAYVDFGYNTYITWRGLDFAELAKSEKEVKLKMFNRICKWEMSLANPYWKNQYLVNI